MKPHTKIAFIGYSGHAYVCIETAISLGFEIGGYYDIQEQLANPYNLYYLGTEDHLKEVSSLLFIAIGDNYIRQRVKKKLNLTQSGFATLIHPKAIVSQTAEISQNVLVSAGAVINAQAKIGFGSIINTGAIIEHECLIHPFSHIAPGAVLAGNVQIGELSFIGANSVIKQGVKIGKNVLIGAGSVVLSDVPDNVTIVGNPARIIKRSI